MAKKEETKLAEKWDADLENTFGKALELENIQQVTKVGTPDRLGCLLGLFIALEYKTEEGKPSKIQLLKLARYKRAGAYTAIVTPTTYPFVKMELMSIYEKKLLQLSK